jgi:hypothetical protein
VIIKKEDKYIVHWHRVHRCGTLFTLLKEESLGRLLGTFVGLTLKDDGIWPLKTYISYPYDTASMTSLL